MIGLALSFAAGFLVCCFVPDKLRSWVRGVAGSARSVALGARSAPAAAANAANVVSTVTIGAAKTLAFVARNPALIIVAGLLLAWALLGTGCVRLPFTETREHAQMRADAAQAEIKTRDKLSARDQELAHISQGVAVLRAQISALSQHGLDAIDAATPANEAPLDSVLVSAWRDSINSMREHDADANGDRANSSGPSASR